MFVGTWSQNYSYSKGDIVYVSAQRQYYICSEDHDSTLVYPSEEDIYWVVIDNDFLYTYAHQRALNEGFGTGISFLPANSGVNPNVIYSPSKKRKPETKETSARKRKLSDAEQTIREYKRTKTGGVDMDDLREQILLMNLETSVKSFVLDKYDHAVSQYGSDNAKGITWVKTVLSLPFGKYKPMKVKDTDSPERLQKFFRRIKKRLDESIYGLDDVKQEILEFVARKITNPHGKGEVLALCGAAGVGKTKLIQSLAGALDLPFFQINCGGLSDVSILTGHSETYVGSKPGKIVECLQKSDYMNPILYLDEIDKIGENKKTEINGILTHLLDEEQNHNFQDNYLSSIPINLSKAFFVIAFNDISKVDEIVSDRMRIIHLDKPDITTKVTICQEKLLPEIVKSINLVMPVECSDEVVHYIARYKCEQEVGMRQLKKQLEKLLNRLNYELLVQGIDPSMLEKRGSGTVCVITKTFVDTVLVNKESEADIQHLHMYM